MDKTTYVRLLPENVQKEIEADLLLAFKAMAELSDTEIIEHVKDGMDSTLNDLEDVLNTNKYIAMIG